MLTDVQCRKAKASEKPVKLADAGGLYLFVTPTGFKSWRLKYRFGGKEKRLTFGGYPEVSLNEARSRRDEARKLLRDGIDPTIEQKQRRAEAHSASANTLEPVARLWHSRRKPQWAARYAGQVLDRFENDVFPQLGSVPIGSITVPMVLKALRAVEERGSIENAHRIRQHLSEIFVMAIGAGLATSDPAAVVKTALQPVSKGRQPAVRTIEEARLLLAKVEAAPAYGVTTLASRLLALTAVRPGVLRLAEASEFEGLDSDAPIWRIPASKMKLTMGRKREAAFEFIVPLAWQSVELVKVAMALFGNRPLLFPSVRSYHRPISDSTLSKLYREAGYSGAHVPHGWRSTFSTVMNELAAEQNRVGDRAIIDLMLAHVPQGVEPIYNRAAYMPRRREIAQEWADLLTLGARRASELIVTT